MPAAPDICLRIDAVETITGLSKRTVYRLVSRGKFPRPIKLTASARGWKLSEIAAWVESRERDTAPCAESGAA
jgi:prophage regulatory protein